MVRGARPMMVMGILWFGNLMGLQMVSSDVSRHHRFGVREVVAWLLATVVLGGVWGWLMNYFTRGQSVLGGETAERQVAVNQALRVGRLDDDPDLRALEFRVAAERYRSDRSLVVWGLAIVAFPIGLYWWRMANIDNPPTGYRWFLILTLAVMVGSGLWVLVMTWRRNGALEQVLVQRQDLAVE